MKKKAQVALNQIVPIVLILVTAGIVIGAGTLILGKFQDKTQTTTNYEVENEWMTLDHYPNTTAAASNGTFKQISSVTVYNVSLGTYTIMTSGNYTIDTTAGTINSTTAAPTINGSVNYTYTLNDNPTSYLSTGNATEGVKELATFVPTIGIIIAAVIIIGLIVGSFAGATRR